MTPASDMYAFGLLCVCLAMRVKVPPRREEFDVPDSSLSVIVGGLVEKSPKSRPSARMARSMAYFVEPSPAAMCPLCYSSAPGYTCPNKHFICYPCLQRHLESYLSMPVSVHAQLGGRLACSGRQCGCVVPDAVLAAGVEASVFEGLVRARVALAERDNSINNSKNENKKHNSNFTFGI